MRSPVGQRRTGGRATEMWMPASSGPRCVATNYPTPEKKIAGSTGDKPGCRFARAQADPGPVFGPERRCRGFNNLRALAQIFGETGSLETAPSATQSCRCSHSGALRGNPRFFPGISGDFGWVRARNCAGETRPGEAVRRVPGIVSRACFRGPGLSCTVWGNSLAEWPVCARASRHPGYPGKFRIKNFDRAHGPASRLLTYPLAAGQPSTSFQKLRLRHALPASAPHTLDDRVGHGSHGRDRPGRQGDLGNACHTDRSWFALYRPGFLDSGLTVFASTRPRPAREGRVAPGAGLR